MNISEQVSNFSLPDQHGRIRSLEELTAHGPVVIFFYPVASSTGCTKEACHFRNLETEFAAAGSSIVGISKDSPARQLKFATENNLSYPLLSDAEGEVADLFGVRRRLLAKTLPTKRATFIVDQGRIMRFCVSSETNMDVHADQALAELANITATG